jgi:flagellar assembly factor FliW
MYILNLHCVENGEYSIIHLLSPTCINLDNQKVKQYIIILKNFTWMHITYVNNQHHYDKIKDHSYVDH